MPSAQLARILADLDAIPDAFRMDRDGLGAALIAAAVAGVKDTIAREDAPDGTPWEQLSPAYEEWKTEHFPGQPIAFLHELMATADEIEGVSDIKPDEASVTYGKTDRARQEAAWFQEGSDENNQPSRPFFDFTKESLVAVAKILDGRFDSLLK